MSSKDQTSQQKITSHEAKLIEETFNIIKNLNKDMKEVEKVKNGLKSDISKISSRVGLNDKPQVDTKAIKKLLDALKEDIVNELTPVMKKQFSNVKKDIDLSGDVKLIIEKEIKNVSDTFLEKHKKENSKISKEFQELESRIVESLKANEKVSRELKKYETKDSEKLISDFEKKLHQSVEKNNKKLISLFDSEAQELEIVKKLVSEQSIELEKAVQNLDKTKKELNQKISKIGLTSFDKRVKKVEDNVFVILDEVESKLAEINDLNSAQENFIVEKINEAIDSINVFEDKNKNELKKVEVRLEKILEDLIDKKIFGFDKFQEDLLVQVENDRGDLLDEIEEMKVILHENTKDVDKTIKRFETLKNNLQDKTKDKFIEFKSFDTRLKTLEKEKENVNRLIKSIESDLYSKQDEDFRNLQKDINSSLNAFQNKLEDLDKFTSAQESFVIDKTNEIIDLVNSIDVEPTQVEDVDLTPIQKQLKLIEKQSEKFKENLLKNIENSTSKTKDQLDKQKQDLKSEILILKEEIKGISKVSANQDVTINKRLDEVVEVINSLNEDFYKELPNIKEVIKEVSKFSEKETKLKEQISQLKQQISEKTKIDLDKLKETFKKDLDKNKVYVDKVKAQVDAKEDALVLKFNEVVDLVNHLDSQVKTSNVDLGPVEIKLKEYKRDLDKLNKNLEISKEKTRDFTQKDIDKLRENFEKEIVNLKQKLIELSDINYENESVISEKLEDITNTIGVLNDKVDKSNSQIDLLHESQDKIKGVMSTHLHELEQKQKKHSDELKTELSSKALQEKKVLELEIKNLKSLIKDNEKDIERLVKKFENFKDRNELRVPDSRKQSSNKDTETIKVIESLRKEQTGMQKLLEKLENDLYSKHNDDIKQIESGFKNSVLESDNKFKEIQKITEAQEKFTINKINEIVDFVNKFEEKNLNEIKKIQIQNPKDIENLVNKKTKDIEAVKSKVEKLVEKYSEKSSKIKENFQKLFNEEAFKLEEKITKLILSNNGVIEGIQLESKKTKDEIRQDINLIFSENKSEFEKLVSSQIQNFEEILVEKEQTTKKLFEEQKSELDSEVESIKELVQENNSKIEQAMGELENVSFNLDEKLKSEGIDLASISSKIQKIEEDNNSIRSLVERYENDLYGNSKQEIAPLENKITELNEIVQAQEDFVVSKVNEAIDLVNGLEQSKEQELKNIEERLSHTLNNSIENKLNDTKELKDALLKQVREESKALESVKGELKSFFENETKEVQEKLAKQVLSNNEFITRLKTEQKEVQRDLKELIDSKLSSSSRQFEEDYKEKIANFEKELKNKEASYLTKLVSIDTEKDKLIKEFSDVRKDFENKILEAFNDIDSRLENLNNEGSKLDDEYNVLVGKLGVSVEEKKAELDTYSSEMTSRIENLLKEEKEKFLNHEETFRGVFSQKINNLTSHIDDRLDKLDKKFLEKNLHLFKEEIKEETETIKLLEDTLNSKSEEMTIKAKNVEDKVELYLRNLDDENSAIKEKIEDRLTSIEKRFNKRFIEFDMDFTKFKSVVIEEVEGIVEELKMTIEDNKRNERRSSVLNNSPREMNDVVRNMIDYENTLVSLVKSLKNRGVENQVIRNALVNKGHPKLYVSMVLDNYDKYLN